MSLTICWTAKGRQKDCYESIREKFGISSYMSVNHETSCDIREEDMEMLRECERRGFLKIRFKDKRL
jgi:predicted transposase YbfD/YdcC